MDKGLQDHLLHERDFLECVKSGSYQTHHTFVPDKRHPLLSAVGALWHEGEVIFAYGTLRSLEGAVSTTSHLQVSTG